MSILHTLAFAAPIAAMVSIVVIYKIEELVEQIEDWVWA